MRISESFQGFTAKGSGLPNHRQSSQGHAASRRLTRPCWLKLKFWIGWHFHLWDYANQSLLRYPIKIDDWTALLCFLLECSEEGNYDWPLFSGTVADPLSAVAVRCVDFWIWRAGANKNVVPRVECLSTQKRLLMREVRRCNLLHPNRSFVLHRQVFSYFV